jgi:hypothetical protein
MSPTASAAVPGIGPLALRVGSVDSHRATPDRRSAPIGNRARRRAQAARRALNLMNP